MVCELRFNKTVKKKKRQRRRSTRWLLQQAKQDIQRFWIKSVAVVTGKTGGWSERHYKDGYKDGSNRVGSEEEQVKK